MSTEKQLQAFQFYLQNYEVIFDNPLAAKRPVRLSDHRADEDRRCRFCQRGVPDVSFANDAHAIPEFLGNRSILSMNECDACNELFSNPYEDHLAKRLMFYLAISQVRGKNGVPTFKTQNGLRVEMKNGVPQFTVVDPEAFKQFENAEGPFEFKIEVDAPSQPYVPLNAACALVKCACSVYPTKHLDELRNTMDWLAGKAKASMSAFPVALAFTPGPNPYGPGRVQVWRRTSDAPIPAAWCLISTGNFRLQFFVPFCTRDTWINYGGDTQLTCPLLPPFFGGDWRYGKSTVRVEYDWSEAEPTQVEGAVTFHVDRAEKVGPA